MLNVNIQIDSYEQGERLLAAVFGREVTKADLPKATAKPAAVKSTAADKPATEEKAKEAETAKIGLTDIRAVATALITNGREAEFSAALKKFGATKLSDVKKEDYSRLYEDIKFL